MPTAVETSTRINVGYVLSKNSSLPAARLKGSF